MLTAKRRFRQVVGGTLGGTSDGYFGRPRYADQLAANFGIVL
jgi:hypothetical protein